MKLHQCCFAVFVILLIIKNCLPFYLSSRVVTTKYGSLRGIIVKPNNRALGDVEMFRGVAYAAPPVGSLRFMPPMTTVKWEGVRKADSMPPVCPQKLPDVSNQVEALKRMPIGRYNYLQKLLPMLGNQSEDCLYLNIYSPIRDQYSDDRSNLPVLVYIHGESYTWNSGNPYDGTVLASYGQVVVVTVNFRLGILGFLRPALNDRFVSNFGILDQIAALLWIRGNIRAFGGDPDNVTLFGHGTGAALANLLLVSPVAQTSKGLFKRAILMSGSALSNWALSWEPYKYTIEIAQALKCPLVSDSDALVNCLRSKTVQELISVPLPHPPFTTALGPTLDDTVIKKHSTSQMKIDMSIFSKYDLLYGVVPSECFNMLTARDVKYGMSAEKKKRLLRTYISNTFDQQTNLIYTTVENEYKSWISPSLQYPGKRRQIQIRDEALEILNDAQVVAPVVKMGDIHSELNSKSYFYVFNHQSLYGDYPFNQGTVHGEELPYVFGAPLVGGFSHFPLNYTLDEQFLSELVMTLWTNFAKTGNPNFPTPQGYKTESATFNWLENLKRLWPFYDRISQQYLHIDMQVLTKLHYRPKKLAVWNEIIPSIMRAREMPLVIPPTSTIISFMPTVRPFIVPYPQPTSKPLYKHIPVEPLPSSTSGIKNKPVVVPTEENLSDPERSLNVPIYVGTPMSVVVLIGMIILFLNCFAMASVYYKRDKNRQDARRSRRNGTNTRSPPIEIEPVTPKAEATSEETYKKGNGKQKYTSDSLSSRTIVTNGSPSSTKSGSDLFPNSKHKSDYEKTQTLPSPKQVLNSAKTKKNGNQNRKYKSENSLYHKDITDHDVKKDESNTRIPLYYSSTLQPRSINKSNSSIASLKSTTSRTSIKSAASRTSIKSSASRTSIKSSNSVKPLKKNASCQSLPTPEYAWGITKEMTMSRHEPDGRDESYTNDQKILPQKGTEKGDITRHPLTAPVVLRPRYPYRQTSFNIQTPEDDLHEIYKKKPILKRDVSFEAKNPDVENIYDSGFRLGPIIRPVTMYETGKDQPTATVKKSRKSDGFEVRNKFLPSSVTQLKSIAPKPPTVPSSPCIYGVVPNSSLPTISSANPLVKSTVLPWPSYVLGGIKSSTNDALGTYNVPGEKFLCDAFPHVSSMPASPISIYNQSTPLMSLSDIPNKQVTTCPNTSATISNNNGNSSPTVDKDVPTLPDKIKDKPLKGVLKLTSAYDKPKPYIPESARHSSSTCINLNVPTTSEAGASSKKEVNMAAPSTKYRI